jgi:glucosylceramidase
VSQTGEALQVTAAKNPDGSMAVVVFNPGGAPGVFELTLGEQSRKIPISAQAIQTILIQ